MVRLRDGPFKDPSRVSGTNGIIVAMEELPTCDWVPGESFHCIAGNELRQALLLAIWRDIVAGVATGVLEKWKKLACTWPVLLRVMPRRQMLIECARLHAGTIDGLVEYAAPQRLQMLSSCMDQKLMEVTNATPEELHRHCRVPDSFRRPGARSNNS